MFESLSSKLEKAFKTLKGQGKISEINIAETVKEIRKALIDADVNYKIAKQFTDTVKEKALGQNVLTSLSPGQLLVKIVNDELTELLGGNTENLNTTGNPAIILMAGLQGSGKTTHSAKLANYFKKQGKSVMMAAADVYRPAAIQQLIVLGEQIEVPVYFEMENKTNKLEIVF
jgi:signal recognition particle subunit SRP54